MAIDYTDLKRRMTELRYSQRDVAKAIGMTESHFARKLKGEYAFTQTDIYKICDVLKISPTKIGKYFFTE